MASKRSWSSPTGLTPTQKERRQYVARPQTQSTSQPRKRLDFGESTAQSSKPLSSLWSKEEEGALVDYVIRKGFVLSWPTTKKKQFWEDAALSLAPDSKRTSKSDTIYEYILNYTHNLPKQYNALSIGSGDTSLGYCRGLRHDVVLFVLKVVDVEPEY